MYGKLFQCIKEGTNYISLKYGELIINVKPELYKVKNIDIVLPIGEKIRLKKYPDMIGEIKEIG